MRWRALRASCLLACIGLALLQAPRSLPLASRAEARDLRQDEVSRAEARSLRPIAPKTGSEPAQRTAAAAAGEDRAAVLVIDLPSGRTQSVVQPDLMATRLAPGSVAKIATLIAALENGVISPDTRFTCRRHPKVNGRELTCVHPDLGRPMSPAEALAHSCNDFFVTIAARLPREALSATTTSLGLGPVAPAASVPLAAVGLDGIMATPEQLLRAMARAADPVNGMRMRPATRDVLLEGLRGAARYGTARAIGDRGIDALAKTGTAPMPGGGFHGLALAVSPSASPSRAVAVLLPGGSGADAASVAAETLAQLIEGTYGTTPIPPLAARSSVPPPRASNAPRPAPFPSAEGKGGRQAVESGRQAAPGDVTLPPTAPPNAAVVRVGRARAGGYDIVQVPLEEYVARVLAGEAGVRSAPAALEALAIAVRTFALSNVGRHKADGFDLCDLTHCQVMRTATAATRQAAAATAGEILTYDGQPASIFYTACCGGQSELPSDVWPRAQAQPFLTRHKDRGCRQMPEWTSEVAASELLRAVRSAGFRGDGLRDLRVAHRSASGRASSIALDGMTPEEITGDDLRLVVGRTLGWQLLKSTAFDVKRTAIGYRFTGRGSGHGVGMCVVGSMQMAAEGRSAAQILAEYFPGTRIQPVGAQRGAPLPAAISSRGTTPADAASGVSQVSSDDVRIDVVLPARSQRSTADVQTLVRQSLREMGQRARVPLPAAVRLVFHPTVESYTRQTRLPWWTAAATDGDRIDLLPLTMLQERGILDRTLRHELAHVLTARAFSGRPVWVKEGAAIYLSGERFDAPAGARPGVRMPCPTDDQLLASQSPAALHDAYARAAACYSAQIAKGRKWDEVR